MDNPLDDDKVKNLREHWDEDVNGEPLSFYESAMIWVWVLVAASFGAGLLYVWFW